MLDVLRKNKVQSFILLLLVIIAGFFEGLGITLIIPLLVSFFDKETDEFDNEFINNVNLMFESFSSLQMFGLVMMAFVIKAILTQSAYAYTARKVAIFGFDLREDFINAFFNARYSYLKQMQAGSVTAHLSTDIISAMAAFISAIRFISSLFVAIIYFTYIVYVSPISGLTGLLAAALSGLAISRVLSTSREAGARTTYELHNVAKIGSVAIRCAKEITALRAPDFVIDKFNQASKTLMEAQAVSNRVGHALKNIMDPLTIATGLFLTLLMVEYFDKPPSEAIITLVLLFRLLQTAQLTFAEYQKFIGQKRGLTSAYNSIHLLHSNSIISENDEDFSEEVRDFDGALTCKNLRIGYKDEFDLAGLNFKFDENAITVISGESGTGKSTFLDCLLGLQEPIEGDIFLGKVSKDKISLAEWRSKLGYVSQDPFLFEGTLEDNIVMERKHQSSTQDLDELIKKLSLSELVSKREDSLKFSILEEGRNLSGGQRQRIALARALYTNPKVLILDEPTSALDSETEIKFIKFLQQLKSNMVIICVSHSLQMKQNADSVIDFNKLKS